MPLSPQDKAYWKDRLGWKAFVFLIASTSVIGCLVWPVFLFLMSWSSGHAGDWNLGDLFGVAKANFWLALLVSTILWFIGQLYIMMDWLPPHRR